METIKVKEIKDDAIINVPVNKHYYAMVKALLYNLFLMLDEKKISEESIKNIINKSYNELSALEQSFYTVSLLLGEIEKQANNMNVIEEKEILKSDIEKVAKSINIKD